MIVCICFGVSDKKVNEIVAAGSTRLCDVQKSCAAGTNCGLCISELKGILKSAKEKTTRGALQSEGD